MRVVYKWEISDPTNGIVPARYPRPVRWLGVGLQGTTIVAWALYDAPGWSAGHPLDEVVMLETGEIRATDPGQHIGTAVTESGNYVVHLFVQEVP